MNVWERICCRIGIHDWKKIRDGRRVVGRMCDCGKTKFPGAKKVYP